MKVCSVEGCGKELHCRGFCAMHYKRARKHGDPEFAPPPLIDPGCKIPECERPRHCKGYCTMHYGRLRVTGDPNRTLKSGPKALFSPEGLKICSKCKTPKIPEAFYKNPFTNIIGSCKECRSLERRSPERRLYMLQRLYGLSKDAWRKLVEKHHGVCAICKRSEKLCVDHCHKTGKVRGLLCGKCNFALGQFQDSLITLSAAIEYLKQSESGLD